MVHLMLLEIDMFTKDSHVTKYIQWTIFAIITLEAEVSLEFFLNRTEIQWIRWIHEV